MSNETDYMHVYAKNLGALSAVLPEAREYAESAYDGAVTDIKQAAGTKQLLAMLGRRPDGKASFDYPKPTELLTWVIPQLVPAARIQESASTPSTSWTFSAVLAPPATPFLTWTLARGRELAVHSHHHQRGRG